MALTINTNIKNEANGYSLDASQVKGGYVVVADEVERNAIPAATKVNGTTIYQADVGKEYRWNGSEWLENTAAEDYANKVALTVPISETETVLVPETTLTFSLDAEHDTGMYVSAKNAISFTFKELQKYRVTWDGVDYIAYGRYFTWVGLNDNGSIKTWYDWQLIGNGNNELNAFFKQDKNLPFAITQDKWENAGEWLVYAVDGSTASSHTLKIVSLSGEYKIAYPENIYNYNDNLRQSGGNNSAYIGLNIINSTVTSAFAAGDGNWIRRGHSNNILGGGNICDTNNRYNFLAGAFNNVTGSANSKDLANIILGYSNNNICKSNNKTNGANVIAGLLNNLLVDGDFVSQANFISGQGNTLKATNDNIVGNAILGNYNTVDSHTSTFISGYRNISDRNYQAIFGKYSAADSTALLKFGAGTSDTDRKNIFVIHDEGRVTALGAPIDNDDVTRKGDFKTINGNSLLGSGDLTIAGGGTEVTPNPTLSGSEAALSALQIGDTKYRIEGTLTTFMVGIDSSLLGG